MFVAIFTLITLLVGWIYSLKKERLSTKLFTGAVFFGYLIMWLGFRYLFASKTLVSLGFIIWVGGLIMLLLHFLLRKDYDTLHKLLILALGILSFYPMIWRIVHWPYSGFGLLLGIVPATIAVFLLATKRIKSSEPLTPYIIYTPICFVNFAWFASFWFT